MSSNPSRRTFTLKRSGKGGFASGSARTHDEKNLNRLVYTILHGDDIFLLSGHSHRAPQRYER